MRVEVELLEVAHPPTSHVLALENVASDPDWVRGTLPLATIEGSDLVLHFVVRKMDLARAAMALCLGRVEDVKDQDGAVLRLVLGK